MKRKMKKIEIINFARFRAKILNWSQGRVVALRKSKGERVFSSFKQYYLIIILIKAYCNLECNHKFIIILIAILVNMGKIKRRAEKKRCM